MAEKKIKLEIGTVYKKSAGGCYYFRYQVNGQRKAVSLKTNDQKKAIARAQQYLPIIKAPTTELISAHVKHAKGLSSIKPIMELNRAWEVYSQLPDRATPATVSEQESYRTTFKEFVDFIGDDAKGIGEITPEIADKYAQHMRRQDIAVDTHNRKIRRLKKIFNVLKDYRDNDNPFTASSLFRKEREEQNNGGIRRLSFTREQEGELLQVLEDEHHKVMNKPEIRVIYHLGMFTGQRMKDCVLLTWDRVDLNRKRIWVKQFKTGKEVTIPIALQLLEVLNEAHGWKKDNYVCPNVAERYNQVDGKGKNTGNNLVNIDVLRVIKWIGLEPSTEVPGRKKKVTVYGFHSLRHSFVSHCAEANVPKAVVLSIIGTNSDIVDKYYTHIGEEAQEKAIMAISGRNGGISAEDRISKALALIDTSEDKPGIILQKIEKILRDDNKH